MHDYMKNDGEHQLSIRHKYEINLQGATTILLHNHAEELWMDTFVKKHTRFFNDLVITLKNPLN